MDPDGAQEKRMKQERREQGTTSERMTEPKGITNQIKIKWVQDASQIQLNLDP